MMEYDSTHLQSPCFEGAAQPMGMNHTSPVSMGKRFQVLPSKAHPWLEGAPLGRGFQAGLIQISPQ